MNTGQTIKAAIIWDRLLIAVLGVLFLLVSFFSADAYARIQAHITSLEEARESNRVVIMEIKTKEEAHYQEIIRRMDALIEWIKISHRNTQLAKKL